MGKMPENLDVSFDWDVVERKDAKKLEDILSRGVRVSVSGGTERRRSTEYIVSAVYGNSINMTRYDANCRNCSHPMSSHNKKDCKCRDCTDMDNHWACWEKPKEKVKA